MSAQPEIPLTPLPDGVGTLLEFPAPPGLAEVLGVNMSAVNMAQALRRTAAAIDAGRKGYICVTGVHGIMEAQQDAELKRTLNGALLNLPDGMPTTWVGRLQGFSRMRRVFGPDFMLEMCALSAQRGYTQFLYGGAPGVATELKAVLLERCPGLRIVGTYTPPFRPLNRDEQRELRALISALRPDIFWVGLSTPKQERFMSQYLPRLETKIMVGVGAAFDFHTGRIQDSPQWVKKAGLQWFHRMCQEPRRLWKRYLYNNPRFIYRVSMQLLGMGQPVTTESSPEASRNRSRIAS